jgi:hypothetical protein
LETIKLSLSDGNSQEVDLDDQRIQELLEKGRVAQTDSPPWTVISPRPASLVAALITVTCLLSFLSNASWYSRSFLADQLSSILLAETRFNAYVAIVFWMCFRWTKLSPLSYMTYIVPLCCLMWALMWEYPSFVFSHVSTHEDWRFWLTFYRVSIFAIVSVLVRRGFRLSLQSAEEAENNVRRLNLATLLGATALLALLLLVDIQVRRSYIGIQASATEFPPLLAMASGVSRSFLWVGVALMLVQGDRRHKLAGLGAMLLWVVSRAAIVVYIEWIHRPFLEKQQLFTNSIPLSALICSQFVQLAMVGGVFGLFLWTGYRFRVSNKLHELENIEGEKFDAIH